MTNFFQNGPGVRENWPLRKFLIEPRPNRAQNRGESRPHMDIVTQLAVFLANKPGTLGEVCDALAKANINIYALTISDSVDHAVVRMVVSDTRRALHLFEERGVLVVENEVIMFDNTNKPGGLARIAARLAEHRINIEYAYLATSPSAKKGLLILRVANPKKALQILTAAEMVSPSKPAR